jgi:hypothetical protein
MTHPYVDLARASIESFILRHRRLDLKDAPVEITADLKERKACFVSLKKQGELRGCIGTIEPQRDTLAEEILENAISASTRDPRFPPVQPHELADIVVSVDVLDTPSPCEFKDLDPKVYGVIVEQGWRRGLLLPDLEGVDDAAFQVDIAAQKGGVNLKAEHKLYRFKVERYH